MQGPKWEVSDILRLCKDEIIDSKKLPKHIKRVAFDLMKCRTGALGGHKLICNKCGHSDISYNSCRNRPCPKCQYSKREQWVLDREKDLIPVRYFHVIFTLPTEINQLAKCYPGPVYDILFKAAWNTVKTLASDSNWLGGDAGMIALLHTWGQNLSLHPHLHCLVPNGAWVPELNRWVYPKKRHFLFPVRVMSKMFRGVFIEFLKKAYVEKRILWDQKSWLVIERQIEKAGFNVFSKLSYGGPSPIIQYLARYSHRVAITNRRILNVDEKSVSFQYKDYRDGKSKALSITPHQFVQRFLLHVLPKGFAKIRHYGILSNRSRSVLLPAILYFFERRVPPGKKLSLVEHLKKALNLDIGLCPVCKQGVMMMQRISDIIMPIRGDPTYSFTKRGSNI